MYVFFIGHKVNLYFAFPWNSCISCIFSMRVFASTLDAITAFLMDSG